MTTITIDIPDELLHNFHSIENVRRTLYENFIIEQRQRGIISLNKASELLGLSYTQFFALLGEKGLSFINATTADLENSYNNFNTFMDTHAS